MMPSLSEDQTDTLMDLVHSVASSQLDYASRSHRKEVMTEVNELLKTSQGTALTVLSEVPKAMSKHSSNRLEQIYSQSLNQIAALGDASSKSEEADAKDDQQRKEVFSQLAHALVQILEQQKSDQGIQRAIRSLSCAASAQLVPILWDLSNKSLVALVLGFSLLTAKTQEEERMKWVQSFLDQTLAQQDCCSSRVMKQVCLPLVQRLSLSEWKDAVAPLLLKKIKASPEKVLETAKEMVDAYLSTNETNAWLQESDELQQEFITTLVKQLKSSKPHLRLASVSMLKLFPSCASHVATSLSTMPQPEIRLGAYQILMEIATRFLDSDASPILSDLTKSLNKETAKTVATKETGTKALILWMAIATKQVSSGEGFKEALQYLRKPLETGTDVASKVGVLFTTVNMDVQESIILTLMSGNEMTKIQKGVTTLIDNTTKKTTSTVAAVDALIAVHVSIVHAVGASTKLPPSVEKLFASASSKCFLYSKTMIDLVDSNALVRQLLPRIIALFVKYAAKQEKDDTIFGGNKESAGARAFAKCVAHPTRATDILSVLQTVKTYAHKSASNKILNALFHLVNETALGVEDKVQAKDATRQDRESTGTEVTDPNVIAGKGKGSSNAAHLSFDPAAIRLVAQKLMVKKDPDSIVRVLLLMHLQTTQKNGKPQRKVVIEKTLELLKDHVVPNMTDDAFVADLADSISLYCCLDKTGDGNAISKAVHNASVSLLTSLGSIGSMYDPTMDDPDDDEMKPHAIARTLCVGNLATKFNSYLTTCLDEVQSLDEKQLGLLLTKIGTLFDSEDNKSGTSAEQTKTARGKLRKGGPSLEDEEWERQMKKELAEKQKRNTPTAVKTLTPEQKKEVEMQDLERKRLLSLVDGQYLRVMSALSTLNLSDIEIGNSCLPIFHKNLILACTSKSLAFTSVPRVEAAAANALSVAASCVYEIDEGFAPLMSRALILCCASDSKKSKDQSLPTEIVVKPFPPRCESASTVLSEMDDFGDALCGTSFAFLFPIVRAALTGPRTTDGTEGALRVLQTHTSMLAGPDADDAVAPLRRDMATTVLELLSHDRSQTFNNPSPFDALVACYITDTDKPGPALSTAELAPLLDERGALGTKNCRVAAMMALHSIASNHVKLIKNNPLIENRIWTNCFADDTDIKEAARKTWRTVTGNSSEALLPPSPVYSISLVPLLSHKDATIAAAAAKANASAMSLLQPSVAKNVQKLCSTFIEYFPAEGQSAPKGQPLPTALPSKKAPVVAAAPKKKPISTGLPKKKTASKKDALSIAGIGKPKVKKTGTKKKGGGTVAAALLKPKEVRTFDSEILQNQFKVTETIEVPAEQDSVDKVIVRRGILNALAAVADSATPVELDNDTLKLLTGFLMSFGLADANDEVRGQARDALRDVVATFGASDDAIEFLLPNLEAVLNSGSADEKCLGTLPSDKAPRSVAASDRRKEGAVVALGSVALHLKGAESESKIDDTIDMLLGTLNTPSESVQSSVANCISKLMKKGRTQERVEDLLKSLLSKCLHGDSLAERRGAAYGISAVIKGSGIASLKKFDVVPQLEEACDSGSQKSKEGSLFAIELLSARLGLLFEPYVIVLLPSLLKSFSDSSDHVRTAAQNTADLLMSKLSAHGVKLVMPAVLTSFNDPAWRTKQASIQMLGSMSHLAPKQLASALPKVVPKLTEAFSDTHPKVKAGAEEALLEITKVVKNPEISGISKILLEALTDPAEGTVKALEALIQTEFLHAIDAPSLSLIVPIIHRGLRDRVASTKRYGALIAGNICTMINHPKDFLPYLPMLLPDLQLAMLDPIPDVRSTSAKAVGSLTRGLGEDTLPDLRSWLISKLRDENVTSAERSGAAQGLTELLAAAGAEVVEDVMNQEVLPLRSHPQASTREGVLWVLTFLPSTLGQSFTPLIDVSLPALIGGLSDEVEQVRDVAMRAGRVLIRTHGKAHVKKILPSLEEALADEDYRIRVASLTLLGDLLSMIGGTSVGKTDTETQEDIRRAEKAQAQIALVLGTETRKRILSALYLARSDTVASVRQSAVNCWKAVVSVTARTLRDILPVLVSQIVDALASGHPERTQVAGRCLGDIVHKLGDSVLPEIIPVLRNALYDGDRHTRRGVCVGLAEVIGCSTRDQILRFIEIIVKVVQDALCDDDAGVREMAASCFQSLHNLVGNRALDEIVPSLLVALQYGDEDEVARTKALNGLTGILSIRSRELLPYIVPRLLKSPITTNHANALAGIAEVTSSTLYNHFNTIIPTFIRNLSEIDDGEDKERETAIRESARSVCRSVDESGVNILISEIASKCGGEKADIRRESCWMFQVLVEERHNKSDYYEQIPIVLRELTYRLNDENPSVLKANHSAYTALTKHVPAEELVKHVEFIRNLLASMVSDARRRKGGVGDGEFFMPGFNIPKGLDPLMPIYQRGILYGNPSTREVSAAGLGELIALTASKFLAGPAIIKMTGPLLRIVGDRNPAEVKVAILRTLGLVLVKGGPALRAFVPQFQTTFVKALADPSRQVRLEAIKALGLLMPLSTRVDPLLKELVAASLGKVEGSGVAAVQTATLEALAGVLKQGGKKAKVKESIPSALDASKELVTHEDEGVREAAAKVMGAACELLGDDITTELVQDFLLSGGSDKLADVRHGKACSCHRVMATMGSHLPETVASRVTTQLISYTKDDKASVKEAACVALGACVGSSATPERILREVQPLLLSIMKSSQELMEVHRAVARGLCVALALSEVPSKVSFFGKELLDCCLQLAMSGSQRVQYAFNDVLWLALEVQKGEEGLEEYASIANFDNTKSMKALYTKVLRRIKNVDVDL